MTSSSVALAYSQLRSSILGIELRPGETLTEARLSELLQTSRTTVRGALGRLENEGLIRKEGRSYIVAPIDLTEIQQAFGFREVLEIGALRRAFPTILPEQLEWVRARACDFTDDAPMEDYMAKATRFHVDLASLCGNTLLVRALEDVLLRLARARWLEAWGSEGRARSHADHLHLLHLIESRQEDAACEHIRQHLERSCRRLVSALREDRRGLHLRGLAVVL